MRTQLRRVLLASASVAVFTQPSPVLAQRWIQFRPDAANAAEFRKVIWDSVALVTIDQGQSPAEGTVSAIDASGQLRNLGTLATTGAGRDAVLAWVASEPERWIKTISAPTTAGAMVEIYVDLRRISGVTGPYTGTSPYIRNLYTVLIGTRRVGIVADDEGERKIRELLQRVQ